MNLECKTEGALLVVKVLDPSIDSSNAQDLRARIEPCLADGISTVLLDLQHVAFVDSSGLGALISLFRRLPASGKLALCGVQGSVTSVLEVTRLNRLFSVFADQQTALAEIDASA